MLVAVETVARAQFEPKCCKETSSAIQVTLDGTNLNQGTLPAQITPSFFCRLDDDVVYWKTIRLSG
jgi:hypothetical protein